MAVILGDIKSSLFRRELSRERLIMKAIYRILIEAKEPALEGKNEACDGLLN